MFSTWLEASLELARRWEKAPARLAAGPLPEPDAGVVAIRARGTIPSRSLFSRLMAVDHAPAASAAAPVRDRTISTCPAPAVPGRHLRGRRATC